MMINFRSVMCFLLLPALMLSAVPAYAQTPDDCVYCPDCNKFEKWKDMCSLINKMCTIQGIPLTFCDEERTDCENNINDMIDNCWDICRDMCGDTPTCPNGVCASGENCPGDSDSCDDEVCYEPTCLDGCGQTPVPSGLTDEACTSTSGCSSPPCSCDGNGNCIAGPSSSTCEINISFDKSSYCEDDSIRIFLQFSENGVLTDYSAVNAVVRLPSGGTTDVSDRLVKASTGSYTIDGRIGASGQRTLDVSSQFGSCDDSASATYDVFSSTSPECSGGPECVGNSECDDYNACTTDSCDPQGQCQHTLITECVSGDGCCLSSCGPGNDDDCTAPPPECTGPSECNDNNACTTDSCGSDGKCQHSPVTQCVAGDGCCPSGCTSSNDGDCTAPPPECTSPSQCNDNNACTTDSCDSGGKCQHSPVTQCVAGDGCCPPGCTSANDGDCTAPLTYDVLIVALRGNLDDVYSSAQLTALDNKVNNEFIPALANDGLSARFLYLDSDEMNDISPNGKVTSLKSWTAIDAVLDGLIPKLKAKYLIIIGGDRDFVQPPIITYKDHPATGSDDPYGDVNGDGSYVPDITVGRMPAPNDGDIDVILNTLTTATRLHNNGGITLNSHSAPIMGRADRGCTGYDVTHPNSNNMPHNWTGAIYVCETLWNTNPCDSVCGGLSIGTTSGKDFVMVLAHGPGQKSYDIMKGGEVNVDGSGGSAPIRNTFDKSVSGSVDVSDSLWMSMACGGAHLKLKDKLYGSIAMTALKSGAAVFIGSSDNNLVEINREPYPKSSTGGCCLGVLYNEVAKKFVTGTRVGDAYKEGKNAYFNLGSSDDKCKCSAGYPYQYHINYLLGDPTLKIKSISR